MGPSLPSFKPIRRTTSREFRFIGSSSQLVDGEESHKHSCKEWSISGLNNDQNPRGYLTSWPHLWAMRLILEQQFHEIAYDLSLSLHSSTQDGGTHKSIFWSRSNLLLGGRMRMRNTGSSPWKESYGTMRSCRPAKHRNCGEAPQIIKISYILPSYNKKSDISHFLSRRLILYICYSV